MLDNANVERVDRFGERLRERLEGIDKTREWGASLKLSRPGTSDYWGAPAMVGPSEAIRLASETQPVEGSPIRKKWLQLNGRIYHRPAYSSPEPWKLQARFSFSDPPGSPLWEKKPPYVRGRQPFEWSLGGDDVWAISYEKLARALSIDDEDDLLDEVLADLRASYGYANPWIANRRLRTQVSRGAVQPSERVIVTLSIDSAVWADLVHMLESMFRPRQRHPERPSYAKLQQEALDAALMRFVEWWKNQAEDRGGFSGTAP